MAGNGDQHRSYRSAGALRACRECARFRPGGWCPRSRGTSRRLRPQWHEPSSMATTLSTERIAPRTGNGTLFRMIRARSLSIT